MEAPAGSNEPESRGGRGEPPERPSGPAARRFVFPAMARRRIIRIDDILDALVSYHPQADLDLVKKAYVYSAKVHRGQFRHSGEPYLSHPLEVAFILTRLKQGAHAVAAGLLHDTVEDTLATIEEIRDLAGPEVASLVDGLTKISKIQFSTKKRAQAENFRKIFLAMSEDIRIVLIKLADRLLSLIHI